MDILELFESTSGTQIDAGTVAMLAMVNTLDCAAYSCGFASTPPQRLSVLPSLVHYALNGLPAQ